MPTTAITPRYYPTLDTVITEQDIPEILGFIREGLVSLLEKIHYKDFQARKSINGDAAFYSLQIVSPNKLSIEIPGTGISRSPKISLKIYTVLCDGLPTLQQTF